jgi:cob(I)alamin adenosyltransferase
MRLDNEDSEKRLQGLIDSQLRSLTKAQSDITELRSDYRELKNELSPAVETVGKQIDEVKSNIARLSSQLSDRATSSMLGDVRTDLARVMRDFARKTDLDKLKQECVKNCSLKSDLEKLRSESAKKTDFDALKDTTARQAEVTRRCA